MKKLELNIIETDYFLSALRDLLHKGMNEKKLREDIRNYVKKYVDQGDIVPGGGGVEKLRYAMDGKGKRGGGRIIYYLLDARNEVYLITIYAKSVDDDITPQEKVMFARFARELKKETRR